MIWRFLLIPQFFILIVLFEPLSAQEKLLDDFENISEWKTIVSDGVTATIESAPGHSGNAMALDFEFHGGSGYAIAQKRLPLNLPENYKFTFYLRGETPVNNFEFKLLDSLENVYWIKQLNIDYPRQWTKKTIKKRHITFAWGPSGGEIRKVDRIEFVVSAGTGGKGKIFIDDFNLVPMEEVEKSAITKPEVKVSSAKPGNAPRISADGSTITNWTSAGNSEQEWLMLDFQREREIGGLVINWHQDDFATRYEVELSHNGKEWSSAYTVNKGNGGRDYIYLPETDTKFLRLNFTKSNRQRGYRIDKIEIKGVDFSATPNDFFGKIAAEAPRGHYPKYFSQQQTYWTIVGASGDTKEALINEYGTIEVDKAGFSLEPFLYLDNMLVTWNEVTLHQSLEQNYLPIPSVRWDYQNFRLTVTAFAAGEAGKSYLVARYRVENNGSSSVPGKLFIALRPFQVLPPWQELNLVGGVSRIDSMRYADGVVRVNHNKRVIPLIQPDGFGAAEFDQSDITEYLQKGILPAQSRVTDRIGFASGALQFDFNLAPTMSREVVIIVPFHETGQEWKGNWQVDQSLDETRKFWQSKLNNVEIRLPDSAKELANTLKSQIAYILINRDGPAIQPGSRTYERAWIRDGSLTSAALLQTGHAEEVRTYLDWYAPHQYPSGKIPCVVDVRGADPVPEHDSHGQFIYAVMEYFRFTGDTTWLRGKFPHVVKAVRYIQELRRERMTEIYRNGTPEQRACYGLVPESISHEGYSAKPMHSYWDDFFVLRGLKDAANIAGILSEKELEKEFAAERDDFRSCLYNSMRLAMSNTNIDYIPGCVELGDFDATSTTVGVHPVNELGNIPEPQLHNTFEKYYQFFVQRRDNNIEWINYTPYETRLIGTFIFLDQKKRAHELVDFFMKDRRPAGWNHWAEVVWRDHVTPKMIGDMPHTWVGSDFVRSIRSMFVYEREKDSALVIGAGILEDWVRDPAGIEVRRLPTYHGVLNFKMKMEGDKLVVELDGTIKMPPGKIILKSPLAAEVKSVLLNGIAAKTFTAKEVMVQKLPAKIVLNYSTH
ncbi:MAG: discoidin domain-containing protein [candidate division KSB1 bacterium]|nr:discoidin domain-containing protein [candidate division KSB1 bacterium]MDZ7300975.1 discoidin domain-containing protein [candidate division KSB1 bacterium]MDZ7310347.1 discoidin domain-containing protein [candidate division KSB1 bacterium]